MVHEENRTLSPGKCLLDTPDRGKHPGLRRERGDERVIDPHVGPEVGKFLDDLDRGRFPGVVDVLLVGKAHDDDLRTVEALTNLPETFLGEVDDVHLHELVDLAGGLDEAGDETVLLRPIGHVVRVEGDAVTADARAGVERHETVGLGSRGVDHLPGVDAHPLEDEGHLVDESNIDVSEDVLDHLHGLSRAGIADRDNLVHDAPVEGGSDLGALGVDAADDGRYLVNGEVLIPGVNPLGGVGDAKVTAGDEPDLS